MVRYRVPGTLQLVAIVEAADADDAVAKAEDLATEQWEIVGDVEIESDIEEAGE